MKDWNLLTIEEHIKHLEETFIFDSSAISKSVHELIAAYRAKNLPQADVSDSLPKSRCCGRCDGINDICVADMRCEEHNEIGCEICYGKR
jgi:hypothetical protein